MFLLTCRYHDWDSKESQIKDKRPPSLPFGVRGRGRAQPPPPKSPAPAPAPRIAHDIPAKDIEDFVMVDDPEEERKKQLLADLVD